MSQVDGLPKGEDIDIGALFKSLRRNWLLIAGGAVAFAALAWVLCLLTTPGYRAETRIIIASREPVFTRLNGAPMIERNLMDPEEVKSQVEVLTSGDLLKHVSDRLQLTEEAAFTSTNIKPWTQVLILLGMRNNAASLPPEERVLLKLRQNLQIFNDAGTRVIVVQYTSSDASEAAEITSAVADAFIAVQGVAKIKPTDRAASDERADMAAERYYPKPLPIVSATFAAGLLLISVFVLLRELFTGRAVMTVDGHRFSAIEEVDVPMTEVAPSEDQPAQRWTSPFMSDTSTIADENPNGVKSVADRLVTGKSKRVIAVSPEGDNASAATVKLARELADRGKRAILIDMTAYGTLSLVMLDGNNRTGITELLAGERRFNDVIHTDHYSQAHIMPLGKIDPERAMRSAERLPYILDALETVYDFVVIECGPSTSRQIRRIADGSAAIIMNIIDPDDRRVAIAALDMDQGGYEGVIILMDNPLAAGLPR